MANKIRYYTDEHIPKTVIRGLRQRGVDVLAVFETNMLGASDARHIQKATEEQRIIVTQDTDFLRLATQGTKHAGIVFITYECSVGYMIRGLMLIYQVLEVEEMENHIEFL